MTHYALGFLFTPDRKQVVLILKNKPTWQRGLLNGLGGKVEDDESYYDAVRREVGEESGVDIADWDQFATLSGADWHMAVFRAFDARALEAQPLESEPVYVLPVERLFEKYPTIPNLRWLIPLALDDVVLARVDCDTAGQE